MVGWCRGTVRRGPDQVSFLARMVWWGTGRLAKVTTRQTSAPRSGASRCKTLRLPLLGHAEDADLAAKLVGAGREEGVSEAGAVQREGFAVALQKLT